MLLSTQRANIRCLKGRYTGIVLFNKRVNSHLPVSCSCFPTARPFSFARKLILQGDSKILPAGKMFRETIAITLDRCESRILETYTKIPSLLRMIVGELMCLLNFLEQSLKALQYFSQQGKTALL